MKPRVKCCSLGADVGPHFDILSEAGFEVLTGNRTLDYWDANAIVSELDGCVAVFAGSEPYTKEVVDRLPELRVIARTGVGFDAVDLDACDARGIVVTTTPGVNHHSVAEHAIALLMGVARGFPDVDQRVRTGQWKRIAHHRVMGTTLGIVGLGRIGQAIATRAIGLGMHVIAHDPFANQEFATEHNIELVSLEDLLARADHVTLHNPVTPETRKMMNAERFAMMKPGSILINTARGALVDEQALYDALKSGHLRGAGLDVFDIEPLPTDSPLLEFTNVFFAGHLAGLDIESQHDALTMAADTIRGLRDGDWPKHCIQNPTLSSDWNWDRS